MTLEESIHHHAQQHPDKVAVICNEHQITYQQLWQCIVARAAELQQEGLLPHRPYVFRATQDINFVITYCAIHYLQAICVPLEQGATEVNFQDVKAEAEGCTYADDIVDILYTTGTTGKSKGVMLSQTCLEACTDNFICDLGFTPDQLFIISGPLNHIASLFKMHPTLAVGATVCVLNGLKDINAFFQVFDLPYSHFATFLVPASIRMLLQFSPEQLAAQASKIDFIETGAAPISHGDMKRLSELLPHSRLYNSYGGTEIGCACTYNFNDGRWIEGCIGRPMKNSQVEVTDEGHVVVSGRTIMSGYVADEASTRRVLCDGKIHGSDLGFVDEEGMIHLRGREGDVINVGGFKVNPVEVENAASTHPTVRDCICIPATHPVIGVVLKLLVVLQPEASLDKRSLARHIKSLLDAHKVPTYYEAVTSIQRTYNGKIDRKAYLQDEK